MAHQLNIPAFLILICKVFIIISLKSQNTFVHWISTSNDEWIGDICVCDDNGYAFIILQGKPNQEFPVYEDFYKLKYNKVYRADENFTITDSLVIKSIDGYELFVPTIFCLGDSYLLAGNAYDTIAKDFQLSMIWLDQNFEISNYLLYGLEDRHEFPQDILINNSGNIVFHGVFNPELSWPPTQNHYIHFFAEFDQEGNEVQLVTDTLLHQMWGMVIVGDQDNYYLMGNGMIFKLFSDFTVDTVFNFTFLENTMLFHFKPFNDHSYIIAGEKFIGYGNPNYPDADLDLFFMQIDTNANILNANTYGALDTLDRIGNISFYYEDTIFIGGSKHYIAAPVDTWFSLYKTNLTGEIFFEKFYGGYGQYGLTRVLALKDGGCIIAGNWWDFYSYPYYDNIRHDVVIMKVDADGLITNISETKVPFEIRDVILYPNPVRDVFHIATNTRSNLTLTVHNSMGKAVFSMEVDKSSTVDFSQFPSGMYIYTLTGDSGFFETGKFIKQ